MLLYPLLVTLAQAGGPAPDAATKGKRQTSTEYVAITTFPSPLNGNKYCLRNRGVYVSGLELCSQPILNDSMSLFTFQPAPGYVVGQGYYTMKSLHDDLCNTQPLLYLTYLGVNFERNNAPGYLNMVPCGSPGTSVPWFFQWNTTNKNTGFSWPFASPKYSAISSPFSEFKFPNVLKKNNCYFDNSRGGILTKQCDNTQEFAFFGYSTTIAPSNIPKATASEIPCRSLYGNTSPLSHTCVPMFGGFKIKNLYSSSNGTLLPSGTGVKAVNGLVVRSSYFLITLSIKPFSQSPSTVSTNIAEVILKDKDGNNPMASILIGFAPSSTKIQIKVTNLNSASPFINNPSAMISSTSVPLNAFTQVVLRVDSRLVTATYLGKSGLLDNTRTMKFAALMAASFSSPPM